jgi:hypothetical protein
VNPIVITTAATLAGQVLAVLGLWLQLRSQIRQEHAHRRLLVEVARVSSRDGQLRQQRADGAGRTVADGLGSAE